MYLPIAVEPRPWRRRAFRKCERKRNNKVVTMPMFLRMLGLVLAGNLLVGCSPTAPDEREFIIPVDSIVVPDAVQAEEDIPVRMLGIIGPNSCSQFTHFIVDRDQSHVLITAMGREALNTGCFDVLMELDTVYLVPPPFDDPFLVQVQRSEEEFLSKAVGIQPNSQQ